MARLKIPEKYRAGVAMIRGLSEEKAQEIRDALDLAFSENTANLNVSTSKQINDLAATAITTEHRNEGSDFKSIIESLTGLYFVRSAREEPIEKFVDTVSDAMESVESDSLKLKKDEREQFKKNLGILLGAQAFGVTAKAFDLKTEAEHLYCSARILTDLRPIFGSRVEDGPAGLVVTHALKLVYHKGNEKHHEFFVSMDFSDLQALKKLIDRAEAKTRSLKANLKDVRLFGAGKE